MYSGWICGKPEDKEFLESLGIEVGPYDEAQKQFVDCKVSEEALSKLDSHWGRFIWYLISEADKTIDSGESNASPQ